MKFSAIPGLGATRRGFLLGAALAGHAVAARGQTQPNDASGMVARAKSGPIGIISGGIDGTYIRIAADLSSVLDDADRLRILPIIGKGSVQNLIDIAFLRGVDLGIVQSDTLAFVTREKLLPTADHQIGYITKLYDEEVHILAHRDIGTVSDLGGRPVNVDVLGSGTSMTAKLIFDTLKIAVEPRHYAQDVAVQMLHRGDLAAAVFVTGKPARLFTAMPDGGPLHFLAIPSTDELIETYLPAELEHEIYPALIPSETSVPTVAVGALMAVFGWPAHSDRRVKVDRFVAALRTKLADLQKPPHHPKWLEVNLAAQAPGWVRYGDLTPPPLPRQRPVRWIDRNRNFVPAPDREPPLQ